MHILFNTMSCIGLMDCLTTRGFMGLLSLLVCQGSVVTNAFGRRRVKKAHLESKKNEAQFGGFSFFSRQERVALPKTGDKCTPSSEGILHKKHIVVHPGRLRPEHHDYKGSSNIQRKDMQWEDGSMTYEPRKVMAADDPEIGQYAKENGLLNAPDWRQEVHTCHQPSQASLLPQCAKVQK